MRKNDVLTPDASLAVRDPLIDLAAHVLAAAALDLTDTDPVRAVDALIWFLSPDSSAPLFTGVLLGKHPIDLLRQGAVRPGRFSRSNRKEKTR